MRAAPRCWSLLAHGQIMKPTEAFPEHGRESSERVVVWKAERGHCRVICSTTLLESIRHACVMAARGPVPLGIGGALMGGTSAGDYQVRHWHPIPCHYQRGPSFLLTKDEVAGLKEFLAQLPARTGQQDEALIGWFVSHPFRGAELRDDEISLHQRFFRSSDLFFLIEVRPDGAIEVTVHLGARPLQPVWRIVPSFIPQRDRSIPVTPSLAVASAHPAPLLPDDERPSEPRKPDLAPRVPRAPLVLTLGALALVLVSFIWFRPRREAPPPPPPVSPQPVSTLSLRVERREGAFLIRWNPVEPSLAPARDVVLRITDGAEPIDHPLPPALLRSGSFLHKSAAASIEVEMRATLPDGRVVSERVLYGQ